MAKQKHSVRPSKHFKAAAMDKDNHDGTMTIRVNENDNRYGVYIMRKKPPKKKARGKDFFQLSLNMPSVMIQGINWRKKRNNDDGIIEPQ